MLERVSANISFALDNFEHEAARKSGERVMRRLNRMFGAISATNEAILRAKTEQELYQWVCDAAVYSGKSAATVVLLAEPDSIWLKPAAGTGAIVEQIMRAPFSIDAGNPMERASAAGHSERSSPRSITISSTRPRGSPGIRPHARPASPPASRFR